MMVRVSLLSTRDELHQFGEAWEGTLQGAGEPSPYLGFDWINAWWDYFGQDRELMALVAEDVEGIVGLAPLAIGRYRLKGIPVRVLEFIGAPFRGSCSAGYLDFVVLRRHRECLTAFAEALLAQAARWDLMSLRNVPAKGAQMEQLCEVAGPGLTLMRTREDAIPGIRADGWHDYVASRRHSFRRSLRRYAREAQEAGLGPARRLTTREEVTALLPELARVRAASWQGKLANAGAGSRMNGFLASLLPRLCARGRAVLVTLSAQDRVVAYQLGFRDADALWLHETAYDQAYSDASPGANAFAAIIEYGLADHVSRIDLGAGLHWYKRRWATEYTYRAQWLGFHRGLRSRALACGAHLVGGWRRRQPHAPPLDGEEAEA